MPRVLLLEPPILLVSSFLFLGCMPNVFGMSIYYNVTPIVSIVFEKLFLTDADYLRKLLPANPVEHIAEAFAFVGMLFKVIQRSIECLAQFILAVNQRHNLLADGNAVAVEPAKGHDKAGLFLESFKLAALGAFAAEIAFFSIPKDFALFPV